MIKEEVLTYFKERYPSNLLLIIAFSGARGNISKVRQDAKFNEDPKGQIIDLPIQSSFLEGLNVTEYIITSYCASSRYGP